MSVSIATMGLFNQPGGGVTPIISGGGGPIRVPEEKVKPIVTVTKIISSDEDTKNKIEIISITGD